MIYEYTAEIFEKRNDNKIYYVYHKKFFNLKEAYKSLCIAVNKMTGEPCFVVIYKNIIGGFSIPSYVFQYGKENDCFFNNVDFYL